MLDEKPQLQMVQVEPAEAWAAAEDAVDDMIDTLARMIAREHHEAEGPDRAATDTKPAKALRNYATVLAGKNDF